MAQPFTPQLGTTEIESALPGNLKVVRRLPPGGQGALFVVTPPTSQAVVKIYQDAHRLRAQRESEALERLSSDYIVDLLKWGSVPIRGTDCIYTVTEFIEGENLRDLLVQRPMGMGEQEVRRLGTCLTHAIAHLWSTQRIVHRDIKPKNIMVRPNGDAVLIDLGIARHRDLTTETASGVVWGTEGYKSPEQAGGRRALTFRSDLFALGVVLHEAASGLHPFAGHQYLIGAIPVPSLPPTCQVSAGLSDLIGRMLQYDPIDRPADLSQLLTDLK